MNNHIKKWLLLILFLCSTSLYAERNYLYVSDFIEKQALPYQGQSNYNSSWRNASQHYKYNDLYLNQSMEYQQAINVSDYPSYSSNNKFQQVYPYPVKNYNNHFEHRIYEPSTGIERMRIPDNTDKKYNRIYSNVLYVSDLEPDRRTLKKKHQTMLYEFKNSNGYTKEKDTIRYIPNLTYPFPKTQSSYNSNIFTSEGMTPFYRNDKPDYNLGGSNHTYGIPYDSLSRFGIFSIQ
ncbi:MAG: hypothetical protein OQL19_22360 [Gammaproteobacteria bacterium]|nr:hypothetical protein [Gammaproteobacteria bacterium]